MAVVNATLDFRKQPRQMTFLNACGLGPILDGKPPTKPVAKVIGYGGSAGGGKTKALLVAAILMCMTYPGARVGYFRRTFSQLEGSGGAIMESFMMLSTILGTRAYNGKLHRWTFPNGSIITFCYMNSENDKFNYQSQQFDCLLFDEAGQFTWPMISYMFTRIRASSDDITTFTAMASNPGGPGHAFFKANFVNAGPPEQVHVVEIEEGKYQSHIFIPAKLSDNQVLEERDPTYRKNLENQPEIIRRQLLDGDFDAAEGLAFSEWRENIHTCTPFDVPDDYIKFRALDWGYAKPYAVGWYCVDHDGRVFKYRELYGWNGKPDQGCKEDPEDVARKIIELEKGERIFYAVADDAVFGGRQDNSPSIAEQFADAFGTKATHWQPVGKGPRSRISGKLEFHHRLKWTTGEDGKWDGELPMFVYFNTCRHAIRTIPNLILDPNNNEDVESHNQEEHIYDCDRYAMMSRPITPRLKQEKEETRIQKHKKKLASQRQSHIRRVL